VFLALMLPLAEAFAQELPGTACIAGLNANTGYVFDMLDFPGGSC